MLKKHTISLETDALEPGDDYSTTMQCVLSDLKSLRDLVAEQQEEIARLERKIPYSPHAY